MAEIVLSDPFISINGTDMSDHFKSISHPIEAEAQEATAFGDEWRHRVGGLKDATATLEYNQDYDAGALDATLFPLLATRVTLAWRYDSAIVGPNNPQYAQPMILTSYMPIEGSVGDLIMGSVTLEGAGALTRAVT